MKTMGIIRVKNVTKINHQVALTPLSVCQGHRKWPGFSLLLWEHSAPGCIPIPQMKDLQLKGFCHVASGRCSVKSVWDREVGSWGEVCNAGFGGDTDEPWSSTASGPELGGRDPRISSQLSSTHLASEQQGELER